MEVLMLEATRPTIIVAGSGMFAVKLGFRQWLIDRIALHKIATLGQVG
jgi:hypothetical protein